MVRNPLYVGSFLMMMGFCILCRDWPTMLFVAGPMSYLYWKQVRFEEDKLSRMFPLQWDDYIQSTPRFIPVRLNRAVLGGWSLFEWQRNREHQAIVASLLGSWAFGSGLLFAPRPNWTFSVSKRCRLCLPNGARAAKAWTPAQV
ncbi:MAG: hypothetical protein R3C56_02605 [Pirellulaceae bacterium]